MNSWAIKDVQVIENLVCNVHCLGKKHQICLEYLLEFSTSAHLFIVRNIRAHFLLSQCPEAMGL